MGSPYTHIYNWYFPESFVAHRTRHGENDSLWPAAAGGSLAFWINIFRVDDFVGTHIDAQRNNSSLPDKPQFEWPQEKPVAINGHTDYWTDANVFPLLQEALNF